MTDTALSHVEDVHRDRLRQTLTVLTALSNPLVSQLPQLTGTGRTIGDQSEIAPTLLVPWPPAFAIWGPIFLGLLIYAVVQALPRNRERPIFRAIGWFVIAAMGLSTLWALAASYAPVAWSSWLTAILFVPYTLAAVQAMVVLSRRRTELSRAEGWTVRWPVSLFAGWVSLAVFLNWEQVFAGALGLPALPVALVMLTAALGWIVWNQMRAGGNWVYGAAVLWGLTFLAYERIVAEGTAQVVGLAAVAGVAVVVAATRRAARA